MLDRDQQQSATLPQKDLSDSRLFSERERMQSNPLKLAKYFICIWALKHVGIEALSIWTS